MFKTLREALKVKDIRKRLIFTFLMLIVVRFGSQLPVPGVNSSVVKELFSKLNTDAFNLFNSFTGGSMENFSCLHSALLPTLHPPLSCSF